MGSSLLKLASWVSMATHAVAESEQLVAIQE